MATRGRGQNPSQLTPQISASMSTLDFGSVTVNTSITRTISVSSTGTAPVTVNAVTVSGTGFTLTGATLPVTLNPGQSIPLTVQFSPATAGAASGQVAINSTSPSGPTTVALSGSGTTALSPQLTLSGSSLSFESVTVNTSTTQSLTLSSTGTAPVTVSSAAVTGAGFSLVGGVLPVTLNPGQSMTLQIQFSPAATGPLSGQLAISSDSSSSGATTVALSGSGTAALSPQLTLSAGALSFGSVTVNRSTTQSLTFELDGHSAGDSELGHG